MTQTSESTANFGCGEIKIETHKSVHSDKSVVSIRGIDVHEACDGYSPQDLRAIARYLENLADTLQYQNEIQITEPLFHLD